MRHRQYNSWSLEEEATLRHGVQKHGIGSWESIRSDPEFADLLRNRSGVQLKDKWRNLVKFDRTTVVDGLADSAGREEQAVEREGYASPTLQSLRLLRQPSYISLQCQVGKVGTAGSDKPGTSLQRKSRRAASRPRKRYRDEPDIPDSCLHGAEDLLAKRLKPGPSAQEDRRFGIYDKRRYIGKDYCNEQAGRGAASQSNCDCGDIEMAENEDEASACQAMQCLRCDKHFKVLDCNQRSICGACLRRASKGRRSPAASLFSHSDFKSPAKQRQPQAGPPLDRQPAQRSSSSNGQDESSADASKHLEMPDAIDESDMDIPDLLNSLLELNTPWPQANKEPWQAPQFSQNRRSGRRRRWHWPTCLFTVEGGYEDTNDGHAAKIALRFAARRPSLFSNLSPDTSRGRAPDCSSSEQLHLRTDEQQSHAAEQDLVLLAERNIAGTDHSHARLQYDLEQLGAGYSLAAHQDSSLELNNLSDLARSAHSPSRHGSLGSQLLESAPPESHAWGQSFAWLTAGLSDGPRSCAPLFNGPPQTRVVASVAEGDHLDSSEEDIDAEEKAVMLTLASHMGLTHGQLEGGVLLQSLPAQQGLSGHGALSPSRSSQPFDTVEQFLA